MFPSRITTKTQAASNPPDVIYRDFRDCATKIWDGDLLLFRRRNLISRAGRGVHSHAAKAAWWNEELFCLEVREFFGGRAVRVESQVRKYPGKIDVFRANSGNRWPFYDRRKATRIMQYFLGCDYGYVNVFVTAMTHLPLMRTVFRPELNDTKSITKNIRPPFCSQACALADRLGGGVDPVPHLADRFTEPADLARSVFYEYMFTMT